MRQLAALLLTAFAASSPGPALAAGAIRRYALVAGANDGGPDRPRLQYAVADAQRFARVLVELGGVAEGDAILLKQPSLRELEAALGTLGQRVAEANRAARGDGGGRTELVLYYSGHADDKGLLLGSDRYSYRGLRDRLDEVPADVRIAVLDACASGAITRLKGGKPQPPFLVDASSDMRGHAFLTSSAETEAAQESDRIGASYFTHFLISGLRGAADVNGEGKVTLNEAYQFAFQETLGRTVDTKGGAQHPSYDINLSGTGDVVMTDLRQTSSTLVLGEELDGRFFVRNARQELVAELFKPAGRRVELGIEPGAYEVRVEREAASLLATAHLAEGGRVVLEPGQFVATAVQPTRARGGPERPPYAVAGRNRLELRFGMWHSGISDPFDHVDGAQALDLVGGLEYARFLSERLTFTFGVHALSPELGTSINTEGVFWGSQSVVAMPLGFRYNPFTSEPWRHAAKPYFAVGVGPVIGEQSGSSLSRDGSFYGERLAATIGGFLGAGVDVHLTRHFSIGMTGGFNWMADLPHPIAGRDNWSGWELSLGFGWVFGKGSTPSVQAATAR